LGRTVGPAVLDEAQKEPSVFEKVKWAFDAGEVPFTVLLGSSRLALMRRVRETLAGRAFLFELWPLCALELRHAANEAHPPLPLAYDLAVGPGRTTSDSARRRRCSSDTTRTSGGRRSTTS
jgi:predicted AAA+ superfamily ATPase